MAATVFYLVHHIPVKTSLFLVEGMKRRLGSLRDRKVARMKYLIHDWGLPAFKAKLPTLLQSDEKPSIIYSWSGGVMRAQNDAGPTTWR